MTSELTRETAALLHDCAEHRGWAFHRFYVFEVLPEHREVCTGDVVRCEHCHSSYDRPETS